MYISFMFPSSVQLINLTNIRNKEKIHILKKKTIVLFNFNLFWWNTMANDRFLSRPYLWVTLIGASRGPHTVHLSRLPHFDLSLVLLGVHNPRHSMNTRLLPPSDQNRQAHNLPTPSQIVHFWWKQNGNICVREQYKWK